MRIIVARCSVEYVGRMAAYLPMATRLIVIKADGSVLIHSDAGVKALNWMAPPCRLDGRQGLFGDSSIQDGSYKPLNWMSPPCRLEETPGLWRVVNKAGEELRITIEEIVDDSSYSLGVDPGLVKDGVEAHLQELLAAQPGILGEGWRLVRREYPTAIGPVDLMCRDGSGVSIAVEVKRRGEIDGVEQLTRYLELLNRNPLLAPVHGVLAAQEIKPQARVLAADRDIRCITLDYDAMRGTDDGTLRLF